jgi:hypothetical protein
MYSKEKLLEMLSSNKASVREDACEWIRISQESSPEIVTALEKVTHDENIYVAKLANAALSADIHHQMAITMGIIKPDKLEVENIQTNLTKELSSTKEAIIVQKWEYKYVRQVRGFKELEKNKVPLYGTDWETLIDGSWKILDSFEGYLDELGEHGWELVSVVAESNILGGYTSLYGFTANLVGGGKTEGSFTDYAGFTDTEKFFFKRP